MMSPYIPEDARELYREFIKSILHNHEEFTYNAEGDMAYIITMLLEPYWSAGRWTGKMEAIKILEAVKLEIYERCIKPHEKMARKKNGDVFK